MPNHKDSNMTYQGGSNYMRPPNDCYFNNYQYSDHHHNYNNFNQQPSPYNIPHRFGGSTAIPPRNAPSFPKRDILINNQPLKYKAQGSPQPNSSKLYSNFPSSIPTQSFANYSTPYRNDGRGFYEGYNYGEYNQLGVNPRSDQFYNNSSLPNAPYHQNYPLFPTQYYKNNYQQQPPVYNYEGPPRYYGYNMQPSQSNPSGFDLSYSSSFRDHEYGPSFFPQFPQNYGDNVRGYDKEMYSSYYNGADYYNGIQNPPPPSLSTPLQQSYSDDYFKNSKAFKSFNANFSSTSLVDHKVDEKSFQPCDAKTGNVCTNSQFNSLNEKNNTTSLEQGNNSIMPEDQNLKTESRSNYISAEPCESQNIDTSHQVIENNNQIEDQQILNATFSDQSSSGLSVKLPIGHTLYASELVKVENGTKDLDINSFLKLAKFSNNLLSYNEYLNEQAKEIDNQVVSSCIDLVSNCKELENLSSLVELSNSYSRLLSQNTENVDKIKSLASEFLSQGPFFNDFVVQNYPNSEASQNQS